MNKKFLFAMALPLVFTACSQEELVNEAPNQGIKTESISGLALNIAKESGSEFESRATMNSSNVLTFEKDDNVSLYWLGDDTQNLTETKGRSNSVYYTEDGSSFQSKSVVYEGYNLLTYPADLTHVTTKDISVIVKEIQDPANYVKNWVYVGDSALQIHMPIEYDTNGDNVDDSWVDPLYMTVYGSLSDYATAEEVVASNVSGYNKGLSTGMKPMQTDLHLTLKLKNVPTGANVVVNKVELVSASKMFSLQGKIVAGDAKTNTTVLPKSGSKATYLNPWYEATDGGVNSVAVDCSNIAVSNGEISFHMLLNPIMANMIKITYATDGTPTYSLVTGVDQPKLKVYTNYGIVTIGGSASGTNNQNRVIFKKDGTTAAAASDNDALLAMIGATQRLGYTKVGTNSYRVKNKGWYVPRVVEVDMNNADINNMHVTNNSELNAVLKAAKNLPIPPTTLNVYLEGSNGKFTLTDLSEYNAYTGTLNLMSCGDHTGKSVTTVVVNTTNDAVLPASLNVTGATIEIPATSAITSLEAGSSSLLTHSMPITNKKTTGLTVNAYTKATITNKGAALTINGGDVTLKDNTNGTVTYVSGTMTVTDLTTAAKYGVIKYSAATHAGMKDAMTKGVNEVTIKDLNLGFFSEEIDATLNTYKANGTGLTGIVVIFDNCGDLKDLQGGLTAKTVTLKNGTKATNLDNIAVTNWNLYNTTTLGAVVANANLNTLSKRTTITGQIKVFSGATATINGIYSTGAIKVFSGATANITTSAWAPKNLAVEGTVTYAAKGATGTIEYKNDAWVVTAGTYALNNLVVTGTLNTGLELVASNVYIGSNTNIIATAGDGVGASSQVYATKYEQIAGTTKFVSNAASQLIWSGATSVWNAAF